MHIYFLQVAKATYATLALFYIIYRVRRKGAPPPPGEGDDCACDEAPQPEPSQTKPEKQCTVCRERRPKEFCLDEAPSTPPASSPPSPPPPAAGGAAPARRKCPCEDKPRQVAKVEAKEAATIASIPVIPLSARDEVHPARELFGQVHEAAARIVRNVLDVVMGNSSSMREGEEKFSSCTTFAAAASDEITQESNEQLEEGEEQLLSRHRRTGPRLCVPATSGSDASDQHTPATQIPQSSVAVTQSVPSFPGSQSQSQTTPMPQTRYRGIDDEFSEIYFDDYDD